jgi:AraC-like DNA-binding protein
MTDWENAKAMCSRCPRGAMYNMKKQFFVGFQSHIKYDHRVKNDAMLLRFTLSLVLDGCGFYRDNTGCETELYPGLVMLRPPHTIYSVQRESVNGKLREFVLNLPAELYNGLLDAEVVPRKTVIANLILNDSLFERTINLIKSLESVSDYNFAPWLVDVIRYLDYINQLINGSQDDQNKRLLRQACKVLESNPEEIMNITKIAAQLGVSTRTLRNIFHTGLGVSPKDYRLHYKFEYAGRMLVYSPVSVKEIAYQTGYANAQGFCRQFRRIMGCSPGEYRKKHGSTAKA